MHLETLLPLGKVDPGPRAPETPLDISTVGRGAARLGSQVRAHIRRRYGIEWHPPGPWMRDYVRAVRAVWDCWQHGTRLDHQGEHYRLDLMVPLFDAGPVEHPDIPIQLAAVNTGMCAIAGEVADGVRPHPVCTPSYLREVMLPRGPARRRALGALPRGFRVAMKPLVVSAPTEEELQAKVRDARARIAFYASTPGYATAFEHHGLGELSAAAQRLSRAKRWEELPPLVDDDVLHRFVTVGTHEVIADRLLERYRDVVTDIEFSIAVRDDDDLARLAEIAARIQGDDEGPARETITGAA